jgi:hypothetical protein
MSSMPPAQVGFFRPDRSRAHVWLISRVGWTAPPRCARPLGKLGSRRQPASVEKLRPPGCKGEDFLRWRTTPSYLVSEARGSDGLSPMFAWGYSSASIGYIAIDADGVNRASRPFLGQRPAAALAAKRAPKAAVTDELQRLQSARSCLGLWHVRCVPQSMLVLD